MATCPECQAKFEDHVETCPEHGVPLVPDELMASGEEALREGTMVGEYRVEHKIGAGTFGDVYAGEQPVIGKRVAIKVLNRRFASDPVMVSRFVAEARAVNKIRQRNIIDIFSFGVLPGTERHYFVMELLDGMTLRALLDRTGRLPVAHMLSLVRGIAEALDAVHESGITHRDLKPDNVFLVKERDGSYFPKLLDFGIAKLLGENVAHKTGSGIVLGTPRYMSPEQARGKRADHRADIYALGVMIHEMLTGTALFEGDSAVDMLLKHAVEEPAAMSEVCPDLPPELDAPVRAMLEKRPDDRPPSAGKAVASLRACAERLGLDRPDMTFAELLDRGVPTITERPKFVGTTLTMDARKRKTPAAEKPPPSSGADPMSKTERAPSVPPEAGATLRSAKVAPPSSQSAASGQSTESVSALETDSAIRRAATRTRRVWIVAGAAALAAVVGTVLAFSRADHDGGLTRGQTAPAKLPVATTTPTAPTPSAPSTTPSTTAAEPIVKPEAPTGMVAIQITTRPADVEVWQGDQKLGTSASPLRLPRGTSPIDLRLKKAGFVDEVVSITPDRDQTRELNLAPIAATKPGAGPKPGNSAGKLDRILGGRD